MKDHYDFSKMKGKKTPYLKYLKQPVTVRIDCDSVEYFKPRRSEIALAISKTAIAKAIALLRKCKLENEGCQIFVRLVSSVASFAHA